MNIFILDIAIKDDFGTNSIVIIDDIINNANFYKKQISKTAFYKSSTVIKLKLVETNETNTTLRDYHLWDLGRPNAYHIVCSPKFKSILETLNLPPHRFYPAEISIENETHNYFVLHFIQDYLQDMIYEQSQFCRAELLETEPILQTYKTGEITDYDQYNRTNTRLIDDMQWIYPKKIVFAPSRNYDVWGLQGSIVLSENARKAIAKAKITGVNMPILEDNIEISINTNTESAKLKTYTPIEEVNFVAEPDNPYKNITDQPDF